MKLRTARSGISLEAMKPMRRFAPQFCLALILPLLSSVLAAPSAAAAQKHPKSQHSHVGRIQTGLDVLESEKFASLRGKHVGLITNHTGVDFQGRSTVEVLAKAAGVHLVALFSPEHGIAGHADERVSSSKDPSTGLPIFSLYGERLRPTDDMLQGIDALVFDVQDAGVRFYTYTTTMGYCMEEAAKYGIKFYVLDRPNPITGNIVEGPMLDSEKTSFVAYSPMPVRHGLTIGELAQLFNVENHINVELHVIRMKNWHRNYFFENTGIRWVPPSPNLRTLKGSILYPGLEILQNAGVSVGRGTEAPFEEFGAPWVNGQEVAEELNEKKLPGLHFANLPFIPVSGLYAGQKCGGVGIRVTDRAAVRSMRMGLEIAAVLLKRYPTQFDATRIVELLGHDETVRQLQAGVAPEEIVASWGKDLSAFDLLRRKYYMY